MTDIVYKACGMYIVELKRLPDTITNEGRNGVVDRNYAKFRGNKFFVHSIKHKITNESISEIENTSYSYKKIKYIVGEEISTEFCENLNKICAEGIHFFTSFDDAYYYIDNIKNGIRKQWHATGRQSQIYNYKDDDLDGEYKAWHYNGEQSKNYNYKDGVVDGECKEWHCNGKQSKIYNYKYGNLDGECKQWYCDGKQSIIYNYKDGKLDGVCKEWYCDGNQSKICNYKDGNIDG